MVWWPEWPCDVTTGKSQMRSGTIFSIPQQTVELNKHQYLGEKWRKRDFCFILVFVLVFPVTFEPYNKRTSWLSSSAKPILKEISIHFLSQCWGLIIWQYENLHRMNYFTRFAGMGCQALSGFLRKLFSFVGFLLFKLPPLLFHTINESRNFFFIQNDGYILNAYIVELLYYE